MVPQTGRSSTQGGAPRQQFLVAWVMLLLAYHTFVAISFLTGGNNPIAYVRDGVAREAVWAGVIAQVISALLLLVILADKRWAFWAYAISLLAGVITTALLAGFNIFSVLVSGLALIVLAVLSRGRSSTVH